MRFIAVLLVLCSYLVPNSGITLFAHFCSGDLTSISLTDGESTSCLCGEKKSDMDCCKTKSVSFSQKDVQLKTSECQPDGPLAKLLAPAFSGLLTSCAIPQPSFDGTIRIETNAPPDDLPVYLMNRVFRI